MKNELIIFAAAIALLAGCSKEEGAPAAERPCIRLSTGVEAATRATDVAFEEGDNFGLIVLSRTSETAPSLDGARYLNNGLCTQTAEGVEMPTVKYPEKSADFYAYYPYREEFTAGSSFTFTVQSDQSAGRNYTNSDLMSAVRQNVAPTADAVELTFSHRLTRLDIELMPGEGFAAADELKGATVTAKNVKSSCLFNLSDGSVSEAGTPADLTPRGNGAKVTGEAIEPMQLIVVPQTLAAGEILRNRAGRRDILLCAQRGAGARRRQILPLRDSPQPHECLGYQRPHHLDAAVTTPPQAVVRYTLPKNIPSRMDGIFL